MLILPIVNRNRILNVEVRLKTAEKIRTGIRFADASESDVLVNGRRFSESGYSKERTDKAVLDFIRNTSLLHKRNFLITTREEASSNLYDVYEVEQPLKQISAGLDNLYIGVLTDMRKELPNSRKGRYVSFKKLGVGDIFTDEKIGTIQSIVETVQNSEQWPILFERNGVLDIVQAIDFLNQFDCTVIADSSINEETLTGVVESLKKINTRDTKNLCNYYQMALDNRDVYSKISQVYRLVYGRSYNLIQSKSQKQKQLVKTSFNGVNNDANLAA